jgi:hypothetical protein
MQLLKPRACPALGEDGKPVGWLVKGMGINHYTIRDLDHGLRLWYRAAIEKVKVGTELEPA